MIEGAINMKFSSPKKLMTMRSVLTIILTAVGQVIVVPALAATIVDLKVERGINWMGRVIRKRIK